MLARVWQVVYTATDIRGVLAVQITLDGRRVQALGGEGVPIGAPLRRPATAPTF
jgi:spore germination protein GerM